MLKRTYFMTVIYGVLCVESMCDIYKSETLPVVTPEWRHKSER